MFEKLTTLTLYSTDFRALDIAVQQILNATNETIVCTVSAKEDLGGILHQTRQFKFTKMNDNLLGTLTRLDLSHNVHARFRDAE